MLSFKKFLLLLLVSCLAVIISLYYPKTSQLPIIAIASFGPHTSLEETILGIKEGLAKQGFKENVNINFAITDVNFDSNLIRQMLTKLMAMRPKVIIAITTPVAQIAKNIYKDIPVVFADITDPVAAGLLKDPYLAESNVTGASDQQDLGLLLQFIKEIIPNAKNIGMFYSTSEANDAALLQAMQIAVKNHQMNLVAIAVQQPKDIQIQMQLFNHKVDAIYVGSSGAVQPSLAVITASAEKMKIPVFNFNSEEVVNHRVFASFGVSYYQIGENVSQIVVDILNGKAIQNISPIYPDIKDYRKIISKIRADKIGLTLPDNLTDLEMVK